MTKQMGEPFYGAGKPPEGYKTGDYVEFLSHHSNAWCHILYEPDWATDYSYRLPADHPYYLPPIWCLDKAARAVAGANWDEFKMTANSVARRSIIAHARTLQHGCEPMQKPVDPLLLVMREAYAKGMESEDIIGSDGFREGLYDARLTVILDELRARCDIKPKGEAK